MTIWAHIGLMQVGAAVAVQLRGFWKLQWLSVSGVSSGQVCAVRG